MSKVKLSEDELKKLTKTEKKELDASIDIGAILLMSNILALPIVLIMMVSNLIWDSKITLFLSLSSGIIELLLVALFAYVYIDVKIKIKKLKEKVSTR